jgi:hypothetical protein
MMELPYKVQTDDNLKYYIKGPCPEGECSYYGGVLYPEFRFEIKEEAEKCAKLMNLAFKQGYINFQYKLKNLIMEK